MTWFKLYSGFAGLLFFAMAFLLIFYVAEKLVLKFSLVGFDYAICFFGLMFLYVSYMFIKRLAVKRPG